MFRSQEHKYAAVSYMTGSVQGGLFGLLTPALITVSGHFLPYNLTPTAPPAEDDDGR